MNERIQKLIKPGIIIAALTFAICCLIKKPQEFGDYTSNVSYAVTVVTLIFYIYEKWAWQIIPWNRPPVLKNSIAELFVIHLREQQAKNQSVFRLNRHGWGLI